MKDGIGFDWILTWNLMLGIYSRMEIGIYHSHNPNIAIKSRSEMPFTQPRKFLFGIWVTVTCKEN